MQVSFYVNHKKIYDVIKKFLYKKNIIFLTLQITIPYLVNY